MKKENLILITDNLNSVFLLIQSAYVLLKRERKIAFPKNSFFVLVHYWAVLEVRTAEHTHTIVLNTGETGKLAGTCDLYVCVCVQLVHSIDTLPAARSDKTSSATYFQCDCQVTISL